MSDMHAANLVWRLENMDDRTRRTADARVGLVAHMLRRAGGSAAGRRPRRK